MCARSSDGLEHLPSKQRVACSTHAGRASFPRKFARFTGPDITTKRRVVSKVVTGAFQPAPVHAGRSVCPFASPDVAESRAKTNGSARRGITERDRARLNRSPAPGSGRLVWPVACRSLRRESPQRRESNAAWSNPSASRRRAWWSVDRRGAAVSTKAIQEAFSTGLLSARPPPPPFFGGGLFRNTPDKIFWWFLDFALGTSRTITV